MRPPTGPRPLSPRSTSGSSSTKRAEYLQHVPYRHGATSEKGSMTSHLGTSGPPLSQPPRKGPISSSTIPLSEVGIRTANTKHSRRGKVYEGYVSALSLLVRQPGGTRLPGNVATHVLERVARVGGGEAARAVLVEAIEHHLESDITWCFPRRRVVQGVEAGSFRGMDGRRTACAPAGGGGRANRAVAARRKSSRASRAVEARRKSSTVRIYRHAETSCCPTQMCLENSFHGYIMVPFVRIHSTWSR